MAAVAFLAPTPLSGTGMVAYRPSGQALAAYYMLANASATAMAVISTFYKVAGTTVLATKLLGGCQAKGFTASGNNRLVSTTSTGRFRVTGNATITAEAADDSVSIGIFNSRTGLVTAVDGISTGVNPGATGTRPFTLPIDTFVDLRAGDYIEVHIRNNTGAGAGRSATVSELFVRVEAD